MPTEGYVLANKLYYEVLVAGYHLLYYNLCLTTACQAWNPHKGTSPHYRDNTMVFAAWPHGSRYKLLNG